MSLVEQLFSQFTAADRAGDEAPDPTDYLQQVTGAEREELITLLDEYLARAPRRTFDRAAFAASPAQALTDDLLQALDGAAGTWPALLPRLRHRARLSRAQLVARLTEALGVTGQEQAVLGYYHAMEQGTLPPGGVSDRVLDALGTIVGETRAALRAAGENIVPAGSDRGSVAGGAAAAAFARMAEPDADFPMPSPTVSGSASPPAPPPSRRQSPGTSSEQPGESVDELFTGRRSDH